MKVVVFDQYGPPDVLHIADTPKPRIKDNEILVKVKAAAVTAADSRIRGARFPRGFSFLARLAFGLRKPRVTVLGGTYSGVVEEVGKNVTEFKVGDEVCGMTGVKMGTYAEFIKVTKFKSIAIKPAKVSHEDAAGLMFGGTAALSFVKDKLQVKAGEEVVINGASGAVGTNAVQLAKHFGATVTGVTSADNAALVKSLGANDIIDYTKQNLVDTGRTFDVVVDAVGNISPKAAKKLLNKNGRAGLMVPGLSEMIRAHGAVKVGSASEKKENMAFLLSLVENGEIKVVIDKVYDMNDVVAAHEHVDSGKKVGNLILKI